MRPVRSGETQDKERDNGIIIGRRTLCFQRQRNEKTSQASALTIHKNNIIEDQWSFMTVASRENLAEYIRSTGQREPKQVFNKCRVPNRLHTADN